MNYYKLITLTIFLFSFCMETKSQSMSEKEEIRNELFKTINEFNNVYYNVNKEIHYSNWKSSYAWFKTIDGKRKGIEISDIERIKQIENGLMDLSFINILSAGFYNEIIEFKNQIDDPINIGYLITQNEMGKTLLYILSDRDDLNYFEYGVTDDDPSVDMSEQDYINYHKARIHIIDDKKAIYKNRDVEISLEENFDVVYFIFNKENDKWLLDGIEICPKDKEEEFDIKLIGEPRPIKYYEAEEFDFPE